MKKDIHHRRTYLLLLIAVGALALLSPANAKAQQYNMVFKLAGATDTVAYIARHYCDELQVLDSARLDKDGAYHFVGRRNWPRGIYAFVGQKRDKAIGDFTIDGSQKFTITADAKLSPASVKVSGSYANEQMFSYLATIQEARRQSDEIKKRKNDPATREAALADEEALDKRMHEYDSTARHPKKPVLFFDLVNATENPRVPDEVENKPYYYRAHYWDGIEFSDHSLRYTPQFFNKVNYFFFGVLFHADADTICRSLDALMERTGGDTAMMRYILEFITPRYYRSSAKKVGWDAVWCHIAERYYLANKCPWATEGTLHNMRYNLNRIKKSLIGAPGAELWMADTNQSDDPKDWISSHRFPEKYVILWFWDPDCHHCQEQTAELKTLYDSLKTAPDRRFEVYAVGYESDVNKWKRYVRQHQLPFVNVGGTNVNIDYQEAYNVNSAPTMIILNERREIIMNKLLPVKSILPFLDDYERRQAKSNQK